MTSERRKFRRLKARGVSGHVRVRDEVLALGLPIDNISLGGLFVRSSDPLPVGTPVALELVRPGMDPLKLTGTTVASFTGANGPGMGIRFDALSAEATRHLNRLMVELSSKKSARVVAPGDELDASRRSSFDFGFISHDEGIDEEGAPSLPPRPAT
ncbi:MAG: PilZ domain-containing protein, partial [Myxococcaceae bacterium]